MLIIQRYTYGMYSTGPRLSYRTKSLWVRCPDKTEIRMHRQKNRQKATVKQTRKQTAKQRVGETEERMNTEWHMPGKSY